MKILDGSLGAPSLSVASASTLKAGDTIGTFVINSQSGMSADKAGSYSFASGKISETSGKFVAGADGDTLQVTFTDAVSGDITNTTIALDDAVQGEVGAGKEFNLDLSAVGLGKVEGTTVGVKSVAAKNASFEVDLSSAGAIENSKAYTLTA